jgi:flagellar biosynthesis protein FliQ
LNSDQALHLVHQLFVNALLIAGPLLLTTLAIGVLISVVQVATQLQEMSLSYVPKLLGAVVVLLVFGSWMLNRLTSFALELIRSIPNLG